MKSKHSLTSIIIFSVQLVLLSGCVSFWAANRIQPEKNPINPIEVSSLKEAEQKCLGIVKEGLEKYRDTFGNILIGDAKNNLSASQTILVKAPAWSSDLQKLLSTPVCNPVTDKSDDLKEVLNQLKEFKDLSSLINSPSDKANEDKTKEKIKSVEILPNEIPNDLQNNESEIFIRKIIKYTDEKLKDLLKRLEKIPAPINASGQIQDLQNQVKEINDKLKNHGYDIWVIKQELPTLKLINNLLFILLIIIFAFLIKEKSPDWQLDNLLKSIFQKNKSQKSQGSVKKLGVTENFSGKGSNSTRTTTSTTQPIYTGERPIYTSELLHYTDKLPRNNESEITDTRVNENNAVEETGDANYDLTYKLAIRYYQEQKYDLLKPYSHGTYSATSQSMMSNRTYWGNALELIETHDGLFWIIETIEQYYLLFPNPLKRIEQTRIVGIEYFFQTNFKNEKYDINFTQVSPAFMRYENDRWLMQSKGQINFRYN